jgi:uncharacterized DUF497 family protein
MVFAWDARKAAVNYNKHGVSFAEASTAFSDTGGLDGEDVEHSGSEARRLRLAKALTGRVLVIAYTLRRQNDEETVRIISARGASRKERKRYQEAKDLFLGHPGAFRPPTGGYAAGRASAVGRRAEKVGRDSDGLKGFELAAEDGREKGAALSVVHQ